jgi:hypothetical protein
MSRPEPDFEYAAANSCQAFRTFVGEEGHPHREIQNSGQDVVVVESHRSIIDVFVA